MIEQYANIFYFYKTAMMRTVRLVVFVSLLILIFADFSYDIVPRIALFFMTLFFMIETFFHFKVARIRPTTPLTTSEKNEFSDSLTMTVLYSSIKHAGTVDFMDELTKLSACKFLLERVGITAKELPHVELSKGDLYHEAAKFVVSLKGKFITPQDVLAAYLSLTEHNSKLLFNHQVTGDEMLRILFWTRMTFPTDETGEKFQFSFAGGGFADVLISGWTPETEKYTSDFTFDALKRKPYLVGREAEFQRLVETLVNNSNNNVLIVGEQGSGKETIVTTLAVNSYDGKMSGSLNGKRILELNLGPLIAGMSDRGELETRLQAIIAEVSHAGDVILYIPEFQNILGSSSYGIDLSGALLPYLRDGQLPVIASITKGNFKTYLDNNPVKQTFEVIELSEPDEKTATMMLMQRALQIEDKYRVIFSYDAIKKAVSYSNRYVTDMVLPGSAELLLEDVANRVSLSKTPTFAKTNKKMVKPQDVVHVVEEKAHVTLSEPTGEEKKVLLHLEDKLHERVIDQVQAITAIAEAMRRIRSGFASGTKPISFLFLGPTGVGKTETAKALAALTFGGEEKILRFDMSEYQSEDGLRRLLGSPPGQGNDRGELTDRVSDNPSSLVLLDEFEKANPLIHNLFLQVLEDGRLTDNRGRTVSFLNAIIIATSNAGSEFIRQAVASHTPLDKSFDQTLLDYLQRNGIFKPELLNRFDDVITFKPLGREEVLQITNLMLQALSKRLKEQDIDVSFDDKIVQKIAADGSDEQFGARPLRRYIQDKIEDKLAQLKLSDKLVRGQKILLTTDDQNNIQIALNNQQW